MHDKHLYVGIDGIFYAVQHAQASVLTLEEYKLFALLNDQIVLKPADDLWCNILHLHGNDVYFPLVRLLHFHMVNWHDRETSPSFAEARESFSGTLCGGLRQDTLVFGDHESVKREAAEALAASGGRKFILGTGCVVPIIASHGNLLAARTSVELKGTNP